MFKFIYHIAKLILILTLPFIVLVRGSVYIHENYDPGARLSIICGMGITALLLFIYIIVLHSKVSGKISGSKSIRSKAVVSLLLVVGFAINSLYFISGTNFKNPELKSEIRSLNPILRLAVGTLVMVDKEAVITDASRVPEDYRKMGLKTNKSSLHYEQKDGYSYAIDLRVKGKSEIRNNLTKWYFDWMGFNTLRHGGTGDHLHVSLPCHFRKGGI